MFSEVIREKEMRRLTHREPPRKHFSSMNCAQYSFTFSTTTGVATQTDQ